MSRLPLIAVACGLLLAIPAARADTLLIERAQKSAAIAAPARGMDMSEVERRFGAPQSRLEPRGGQKRQWPTINRWVYPAFTVYFERNKVIDVVLNQASPNETGPLAPIR